MEERRNQEESKKRAAIVAVNDISFPALSGGNSGESAGDGWGAPAAVIKTAAPPTSYSERLKTFGATPMAGAGGGTSTRDQAAELAVFRHRPVPVPVPQFGTSRSSREDTYYDNIDEQTPACADDGWNVVDKRKTPVTKSKINYDVDLTDADYADYEEPKNSW